MALCINQSGTWRNIITQCVNQSGTWRNVLTGCINQSGTWRCFGFRPALGSAYGGGFLICQSAGVYWIVAPSTSEVSRTWNCINDAVTTAQQVSGCTGWYVPNCGQLKNPGYTCRTYWNSYSPTFYWSSSPHISPNYSWAVSMSTGIACGTFGGGPYGRVGNTFCVRAFRCVTY